MIDPNRRWNVGVLTRALKVVSLALATAACLAGMATGARAQDGFDIDTSSASCAADRAFLDSVGGQIQEPILKDFHEVLQTNELADGCGVLQITDARMESHKNGFSFGPSQLDLHTTDSAWANLDGLVGACSPQVSPTLRLTDADRLTYTKSIMTQPTFSLRQDAVLWARLILLRPKIEAILHTSCAQDAFKPLYLGHVAKGLSRALRTYAAMMKDNPALNRQERFLKLYILDYGNIQGDMANFEGALRTGSYCGARLCTPGKIDPFVIASPVKATDPIRYTLTATCWGYVPMGTRQRDALRRLAGVVAVAPPEPSTLTSQDRAWLAGPFALVLAQTKARFGMSGTFPRLERLVTDSGGSMPDPGPLMSDMEISQLDEMCRS